MIVQLINPIHIHNEYLFCLITEQPNCFGEYDVISDIWSFDYTMVDNFTRIL